MNLLLNPSVHENKIKNIKKTLENITTLRSVGIDRLF